MYKHKSLLPAIVQLLLQVTPGQQHYLNILGVKADEMVNLTRETASDLIAHKLQVKEMQAPTEAQLKLLQVRGAQCGRFHGELLIIHNTGWAAFILCQARCNGLLVSTGLLEDAASRTARFNRLCSYHLHNSERNCRQASTYIAPIM